MSHVCYLEARKMIKYTDVKLFIVENVLVQITTVDRSVCLTMIVFRQMILICKYYNINFNLRNIEPKINYSFSAILMMSVANTFRIHPKPLENILNTLGNKMRVFSDDNSSEFNDISSIKMKVNGENYNFK